MSDTGASAEAGGYSNSAAQTDRPQGPAAATGSTHNYGQGLTLLGGLESAWGTYQAGKYNKKVADFNASYARIQAEQAIHAGEQQVATREMKERYIEGGTRSGYASQGVVVGAGTSRAVLESEKAIANFDKMNMEINARRAAYGFQVTAQDQDARGKMALIRGETGAVETLLNTESQELLESDSAYAGQRSSRGLGG